MSAEFASPYRPARDRRMLRLSRFVAQPEPVADERCEICATPIASEHGHLVDLRDRRLLCACRPCYLLFVPSGAANGRYRAVGDRYLTLQDAFDDMHWEALQIPIGLAFFFFNSETQRVNAFYPGPGGATESLLPMDSWERFAREEPRLHDLRPDVEAILVYRRKGGDNEAYLVPIDVCYELAGIVRTTWRGFDGGEEAHHRIEEFFAHVRDSST